MREKKKDIERIGLLEMISVKGILRGRRRQEKKLFIHKKESLKSL